MTVSTPRLISSLALVAVLAIAPGRSSAQNTTTTVPPVIDVHVHAMDDSGSGRRPDVPEHVEVHGLRPVDDPEAPFGWVQEECTPKLYPVGQGRVHEGRARRDGAAERDRGGLRRPRRREEVEGRGARPRDPRHQLRGTAGTRVPLGAAARDLHHGRLQGDGRDRPAVPGHVAERHERRSVLRARRGTRHPRGDPHGHGRVRARQRRRPQVPRLDGRSLSCSRTCWRGTRSCASR